MAIPRELRQLDQWTEWKTVDGDKRPVNKKGSWNWKWSKEQWYPYDVISGIDNKGFYLVGTNYVVIDLDNCFDKNGNLNPWADKIVRYFNSYTEYSPSRKGLHIIIKCSYSKKKETKTIEEHEDEKNELVEIFGDWWITVTGEVYDKYDVIRDCEDKFRALYERWFPEIEKPERVYDASDPREQIRDSLPFEHIFKQYIGGRKKGQHYKCPWHSDSKASLKPYKHSGFCFGCWKQYDVFDIVMHGGVSFPEALEILANEAGVALTGKLDLPTGNSCDDEEEVQEQEQVVEQEFDPDIPLEVTIDDVKQVVHKWLYMEDDTQVDVMLGTFLANKLPGDPVWTVILGPPSSAKTELLRTFNEHDSAFFLSNLTPSTLVSGKGSGKKAQSKAEAASLLLRLDGKTLVLKDFTTILSMRSENKQEILSQFREIYDGQYTKAFGTGVEIHWEGKIGLLTACTPVYDKHYGVIGALGDRFILYRTNIEDGDAMADRAMEMVGREEEMREELAQVVHRFVNQFGNMNGVEVETEEDVFEKIKKLAVLCSTLRTHVDRNQYDKSIEYTPLPEGPARLAKQFMQLGMGIALVHAKASIDSDIYGIICRIAHNLVSTQRMDIISCLHLSRNDRGDRWFSTKDVSTHINLPPTTTLRKLEDLMVIGVLERESRESHAPEGRKPWFWRIKDRLADLIENTQILNHEYTVGSNSSNISIGDMMG